MADSDKRCACGAEMQAVRLDIASHFSCSECDNSTSTEECFELLKGEMPPDLTALRTFARRRLSSKDTIELDRSDEGEVTHTLGGDPLEAQASPSFLSDLRSGLEGLKGKLSSSVRTRTPPPSGDPGEGEFSEELIPPGTELGGYRIVETLGQGGMGVVYKAQDTSLDRFVALKVLSPELVRHKQFLERFDREAKACARLSHPNITTIYQYSRGDYFFAMEYVEGVNLADRIKDSGPMAVHEVLHIAMQTSAGLKSAATHKIIHRDIKPSNLLLTPEGNVKITDFGLAKAKAAIGHTLDLTSTGVVMGTPLFMSPEQARGKTVDHRSDIYSLGATLFFLLYGCPPFEADSPIAIILKHINDPVSFPERGKAIPDALKRLIARMMSKRVDHRPEDYDALLQALDMAARGETPAENSKRRVVVLSPKRSTTKRSMFKVGKLSVARTNLKLGRKDKAVSLLSDAVKDGDPTLRTEAALILLELHESDDNTAGVREMCETILECAPEPTTAAFVTWKLADLHERTAQADLRQAIERYEKILRDPPDALPRTLIEAQIERLRSQLAAWERESGSTTVRLSLPKS